MKRLQRNILFFVICLVGATLDIFSKYLVFIKFKAVIFVPVLLFTMDASPGDRLQDNQPLPKEIHRAFTQHERPLSAHAAGKKFGPLSEWLIYDENHKYLLQQSGGKLHVYTAQQLVPASYYPLNPRLFVPDDYQPYPVIPDFFSIRLALNLGAVWSSFQGYTLMLTLFSVVAIFFIIYILFRHDCSLSYQSALGLIAAGAIGNLWDRVFFNGVRDFLDFDLILLHWPTFNLADAFIVVGIALYIILEWRNQKKTPEKSVGAKSA